MPLRLRVRWGRASRGAAVQEGRADRHGRDHDERDYGRLRDERSCGPLRDERYCGPLRDLITTGQRLDLVARPWVTR